MGPSCGGLTCSFALLQLLSTMNETRSATLCGNSALPTSACTRRLGTGLASLEALAALEVNCCRAAAPSPPPAFDSPGAPRPCWFAPLPGAADGVAAAARAAGETACVESGTATF